MHKKLCAALIAASASALLAGAAVAKDGDEAAIKKVLMDDIAAWTSCETDAFGKYNASERSGYYPDSLELQLDTAENRQMEVDFCKGGGKNALAQTINGVMVMGDTAVAHGSGHYTRTEPDGTVSIDSDYTFTDILVRTAEGWKIKHTHVGAMMPMGDAQ